MTLDSLPRMGRVTLTTEKSRAGVGGGGRGGGPEALLGLLRHGVLHLPLHLLRDERRHLLPKPIGRATHDPCEGTPSLEGRLVYKLGQGHFSTKKNR